MSAVPPLLATARSGLETVGNWLRAALEQLPPPLDAAAGAPDVALTGAAAGVLLLLFLAARGLRRRTLQHDEPCPTCESSVTVRYRGWLRGRPTTVAFCATCGAKLHVRCPACSLWLESLVRFCPGCGETLHEPQRLSEDRREDGDAAPAAEDDDLVSTYETYGQVACRVAKRSIVAFVRADPANRELMMFHGFLGRVREGMKPPAVADIVEKAIGSVSSSDLQQRAEVTSLKVKSRFNDEVRRRETALAECWPRRAREIEPPPEDRERQLQLVEDVARGLTERSEAIESIEQRFRQLEAHRDRYLSLLRRPDLEATLGLSASDVVLSFRAEPTENTWDGWDEAGDAEFLPLYAQALVDVRETGISFARAAEDAVAETVSAAIQLETKHHRRVVEALRKATATGEEVTAVVRALRDAWKLRHPEPDNREFAESIHRLLKEEGLRPGSEQHVLEILDLSTEEAA